MDSEKKIVHKNQDLKQLGLFVDKGLPKYDDNHNHCQVEKQQICKKIKRFGNDKHFPKSSQYMDYYKYYQGTPNAKQE